MGNLPANLIGYHFIYEFLLLHRILGGDLCFVSGGKDGEVEAKGRTMYDWYVCDIAVVILVVRIRLRIRLGIVGSSKVDDWLICGCGEDGDGRVDGWRYLWWVKRGEQCFRLTD